MLNLEDLSQLVAFYHLKTLTRVAEEFHISQPTITRTMKRVEESFGVALFDRSANRIELNEVGIKAAEYAEELIHQADLCQSRVWDYNRKLHSFTILSCAPAPLWQAVPEFTRKYKDRTISSRMESDESLIIEELMRGNCDAAILSYAADLNGFESREYTTEQLYLSIPKNHELAKYETITAELINGYNCLLSPEIGIWNQFLKKHLPNSRFLVQNDEFAFLELIQETSLPCFTTNLSPDTLRNMENRVHIPITDEDACITFYLVSRENRK